MIIDGTITDQKSNYDFNTQVYSNTITTSPYHQESDVKIYDVGSSTIEINGAIWIKEGKKISFKSYYNSNNNPSHSFGSTSTNTTTFNGSLISTIHMAGDYYNSVQDINYVIGYSSSSTIEAKFTISKK